jgi:glycosyltransferase involved in cell wall biosynthesis
MGGDPRMSNAATVPRLSVLTTCWNDGRYLEGAVQSMLRQTVREIEVLILDNGSRDDTWSITRSLATRDKRVQGWQVKENGSFPVALNALAGAAHAPWLLIHNADDRAEPDYVEAILEAAAADPARNCIFSPWQWFGGRHDVHRFPPFQLATMATEHQIPGIRAVRRDLWDATKGEDTSYPVGSDWEWAARAAMAGLLVPHQLDRPYVHVRHHGDTHIKRQSGEPWLAERARVMARVRELVAC